MNIKTFLLDKICFLLIHSLVVIFTGVFLSIFNIQPYAVCFLITVYIISILISLLLEYIPKRRWYQEVEKRLENLDEKFLLSELIDEPAFLEGKILFHCLHQTNKSMNDEITKYSLLSKDYCEYIELWIHEVKSPIASSKLIIENNPSKITHSLSEELDIIEYYLEQSLFYSRSNHVEKDYIIKGIQLKDVVNSVMRRNSKAFIHNKIKLNLENLEHTVYTDSKWLEFILNQLIVNAIKYRKENPSIKISSEKSDYSILLSISDNGIGISDKDIPLLFEKGYTGQTGRKYAKSTGIGLYLCKNLCNKLGLSIQIESEEFIGTKVTIIFPITNLMEVIHK